MKKNPALLQGSFLHEKSARFPSASFISFLRVHEVKHIGNVRDFVGNEIKQPLAEVDKALVVLFAAKHGKRLADFGNHALAFLAHREIIKAVFRAVGKFSVKRAVTVFNVAVKGVDGGACQYCIRQNAVNRVFRGEEHQNFNLKQHIARKIGVADKRREPLQKPFFV